MSDLAKLCFLKSHSDEMEGFFYSHIGWQKESSNNKIKFYFQSYSESCERLYDSILDGNHSDSIIFPFLFMIRHSLEIGMKELIFELKYIRTKKYEDSHKKTFGAKSKGHDLLNLSKSLCTELKEFDKYFDIDIYSVLKNITIGIQSNYTFEKIEKTNSSEIENYMYETFKNDKNDFFEFLKEIVEMFDCIDKYNDVFRYSTTQKGEVNLYDIKSINISLIYGCFLAVKPVLDVFSFKEHFLAE